jgi:hypothetical protein
VVIGLERNWSRAGAMMTTFAGSLSLPRTIHQNDGDISAVASARLRRLARAVRYITSPKRRRNCVLSNRSSMVSALSRTIALNSSLSEAHSLGLSITRRIGPQRNRHLTYGSLLLRPLTAKLVLHLETFLMRCCESASCSHQNQTLTSGEETCRATRSPVRAALKPPTRPAQH